MERQSDDLTSLAGQLRTFTADRGWWKYHAPKNLAMALVAEAGELAAEFQWLTLEESERNALPPGKLKAIESEMADVLIYLVQLADRLDTNLAEITTRKMAQNASRFPAQD